MTTFTNKELIKEIKERISSLEVRDDIERRAYEIALVSLEVEPDEREAYELFMEKRFGDLVDRRRYSAAIFLIPICISFDTAEKRRYATYLILNRRFSFEF